MGAHAQPRSAARSQADQLAAWRVRRLVAAGFGEDLAAILARDPETDLHALLELVDRGCPPRLAARILAPLGSEQQPS